MSALARTGHTLWSEHSHSFIGTYDLEQFQTVLETLVADVRSRVGPDAKITVSIRSNRGTPMLCVRGEE